MNRSLNRINQEFKALATADERVNGYFWGDFVEAVNQAGEVHYPLMLVTPQPGNIGDRSITYSFLIGLMDKYEQGNQRQLTEVHSDMHRIIVDVVRVIKNSYRWNSYGEVQITVATQPFIERGQDFVAGWTLNLSLKVFESENICEIPLVDYDLQAVDDYTVTCDPALIYLANGTVLATVNSGGEYTLPDTTVTVVDSDGNQLSTQDLPSVTGGNVTAPDATYLVEYENGTPIESGSILSGGNEVVQVPNPIVCLDATAELYFDGELIDSLTIPSGGTNSFNIDCSTPLNAVRVSSDEFSHQHTGTFVHVGELNGKPRYEKIGDPDREIIYDGTRWVLEKLGGGAHQHLAAIGNEDFPWLANWTDAYLNVNQATIGTYCANGDYAYYRLVDSDGNVLATGSIPSGDTADITAPDTALEINSVPTANFPAGSTIDVNITDGVNPVTPDSVTVVGNVVTVEVPAAPAPDPAGDFLTATGIVDATITTAIYDLVDELQTGGIWDKIEALYPFVGGTATTHKFNLKDPRDDERAFRLTFFGGITHDANGVTGNGTTGYFRTWWAANTSDKRNNNLGFIYSRSSGQAGADFGLIFADSFQLAARTSTDLFFVRNLNITEGSEANLDGRGFFATSRDNSANFRMYNGTTEYTKAIASASGNTAVGVTGLALQVNASSLAGFSNRNIAAMGFGKSLSTAEISALKTAIDNFQTTLGRNV